MRHRAVYAAFDRVPSAKGAAIHIAHAVRALGRAAGNTLLACVADGRLPEGEREGNVEVLRLGAGAPDLVERVRLFRRSLAAVLEAQRGSLRICHFRDPLSGIPILEAGGRGKGGAWRTVYEVNGLPSIEMPYRFPSIPARTLDRIRAMERRCLAEADHILTPSATLARNLARICAGMGVAPARITVIPNGADLPSQSMRRPAGTPRKYQASYVVEALAAEHGKFLAENSERVLPLELSPYRKSRTENPFGKNPAWLIVHSGPAAEVRALIEFASRQAKNTAPRFVVVSPRAIDLPAGVERIAHPRAWELFPHAERIVTACGFNSMREAAPWRAKHLFLPLERRFDDQHLRAERAQGQ